MIGSEDQPHHHTICCGFPHMCNLAATTKRKIPFAVLCAAHQLGHCCLVEPMLHHSNSLVSHACIRFPMHFLSLSLAVMKPTEGVPARTSPMDTHLVGVAHHSTADWKPCQFLVITFVLGNFTETRLFQSTEVDFLIGLTGLLNIIHHHFIVWS